MSSWRARAAVAAAILIGIALLAIFRLRTGGPAKGADAGAALSDAGGLGDGGELPAGAAIAGRVIDRHGRAAAGAQVWLGGAGLPSPGVRKLEAAADGGFQFAGLPPGRYALRAFTRTEAAFVDAVEPGGAESGDGGAPLLTVALRAAPTLSGRLRERSGAAIPGGEVAFAESGSDAAVLLARRATAGGDGVFRLDAVLPGGYLVYARAEGFLSPAPLALTVTADPAPLDVRLDRGARLDGRVIDEQGRPIAAAQVEVAGEAEGGAPIALSSPDGDDWPRRDRAPGPQRFEPAGELGILRGPIPFPPSAPLAASAPPRAFLSDARGAFHLPGVPAGRVLVAASHPDFARGASAQVTVAPGAAATIEVVLRRGRAVRGRVTDERGAPLGGAELTVDGRALTATDARGEFVLAHLWGAITVGARLPGFVAASRPLGPDETEVELKLIRAEGRLAGVVVDERGAPVAGAKIEIASAGQPPRALTADRAGSFRAVGLGPGPYRVRVEHADYAPLADEVAAPADDVRLQLEPGAGLSGELRDARAGGVPAGVRLELTSGGVARPLALNRGRFELTGLPAGRALLSASAPGYVPWLRDVELPGGERPREITLRDLTVELERGGAVAGTLLDDDGQPVAGAQLSVSPGGARGRSDARGEFRLDGLPAGRVRVRAEWSGRRVDEPAEVRADEETRLELRFERR